MRNRILLIAFAILTGAGALSAQTCTPDAFALFLGIPGVYPNPIQTSNLAAGETGSAYTETLTLITPGDTTIDLSALVGFPVPAVTVAIDFQQVNGVTGLAPGLSYACNISSCIIPGDSSGCVGISGTPTTAGTYTVVLESVIGFTVPANVPVIGGTQQTLPVPGQSWDQEVTAPVVGMDELTKYGFDIAQNSPNPFQGTTMVQYQSVKPCVMQLEVRDLTGRIVGSSSHRATAGENSLSIDGSSMSPGVYLYTLSNGVSALTRKMVVTE